MRTKSIFSLSVGLWLCFSTAFAAGENDFSNPVALFKACYLPTLEGFFSASVTKTLRGFVMKGDSSGENVAVNTPSEAGIHLDVAVRDAGEIPELQDQTTKEGNLTKRSVRLPAPKVAAEDPPQGLAITFLYGPDADAPAIESIQQCIDSIKLQASKR